MKKYEKSRPDELRQAFISQATDKYTIASLILFILAVVIVLLDIIGPIVLSGGHDIISSHLHDQLAFLALLSVPLIPIVLVVGSVLGILGWLTGRRVSGYPSRITILVICLNLTSLLIAIILFLLALFFIKLDFG